MSGPLHFAGVVTSGEDVYFGYRRSDGAWIVKFWDNSEEAMSAAWGHDNMPVKANWSALSFTLLTSETPPF